VTILLNAELQDRSIPGPEFALSPAFGGRRGENPVSDTCAPKARPTAQFSLLMQQSQLAPALATTDSSSTLTIYAVQYLHIKKQTNNKGSSGGAYSPAQNGHPRIRVGQDAISRPPLPIGLASVSPALDPAWPPPCRRTAGSTSARQYRPQHHLRPRCTHNRLPLARAAGVAVQKLLNLVCCRHPVSSALTNSDPWKCLHYLLA
jgi:hypothetical protein